MLPGWASKAIGSILDPGLWVLACSPPSSISGLPASPCWNLVWTGKSILPLNIFLISTRKCQNICRNLQWLWMNCAPWSWTAHPINTSLVTYVKSHGPDTSALHAPSSFWAFPARFGVWLWTGCFSLALWTLWWGVPGIQLCSCWGTYGGPSDSHFAQGHWGREGWTSRKVTNIRTLVSSTFIGGRHKETGTQYVNNTETQSVDAQFIACVTNLGNLHLTSPMPCSCLENPREGGAWWAAVYGITRSRTRLKWLSSSSSTQGFLIFKAVLMYYVVQMSYVCVYLFFKDSFVSLTQLM